MTIKKIRAFILYELTAFDDGKYMKESNHFGQTAVGVRVQR